MLINFEPFIQIFQTKVQNSSLIQLYIMVQKQQAAPVIDWYLYVKVIDFISLYDFFLLDLELFRQCGQFRFSFHLSAEQKNIFEMIALGLHLLKIYLKMIKL